MIIVIWTTVFLHPVIFPCVKHTVKETEKWWDKKRNAEEIPNKENEPSGQKRICKSL
jgi:hypothetical protein